MQALRDAYVKQGFGEAAYLNGMDFIWYTRDMAGKLSDNAADDVFKRAYTAYTDAWIVAYYASSVEEKKIFLCTWPWYC